MLLKKYLGELEVGDVIEARNNQHYQIKRLWEDHKGEFWATLLNLEDRKLYQHSLTQDGPAPSYNVHVEDPKPREWND